MARMAGMLETRMPIAGSATDQFIGMPIAYDMSASFNSAGMKPRRTADVTTALEGY